MKFQKISAEELNKYSERSECGNFMQSAERGQLRERMGYKSHLLGIKNGNGKVIAAGLLVEKKDSHEAWIQNGPLLDWDNDDIVQYFLCETVKYCKKLNVYSLEIYPPVLLSIRDYDGRIKKSFNRSELIDIFKSNGFRHMGLTKLIDFKALRWMFVKNLDGCKDARGIELTFNASTRKKYHQTQRNLEIHVLKDKTELEKWILPLLSSNAKNNLKTRDLKYFEDLWDTFGDKATFVEARLKDTGEIVSSELDIWHKNECVAFLAGTEDKLKKYNGVTAIKGWQFEECLRRGQKRANLYGIDGIFSDDNNLLKSKIGFGGEIEEYIGGFIMVLHPVKRFFSRLIRKIL